MAENVPPNGLSDQETGRKAFWRSRYTTVLVSIVAVLVGIGAAYAWYMFASGGNAGKSQSQAAAKPPMKPATKAAYEAATLAHDGDYEAAQKRVDTELAKVTSADDKAELYNAKSSLAYNAQKYTEALGFAKQSIEIKPTASGYSLAAQSAEQLGDKQLAIDYYKKLISVTNAYEAQEYKDKIKELQQ